MRIGQVCERIVLPNLRLTQDLQEVFEMNFVEYIRRDTEGSDFDTRRRAATELVRSLTAKFPQEVRSCLCLVASHKERDLLACATQALAL